MLSFAEALDGERAARRHGCPQTQSHVKAALTLARKRPWRHRENDDFGKMVLRIIQAYGRRVAVGDPEDLAPMFACLAAMEAVVRTAILLARASGHPGWTWERIGSSCGGVSKQAAQARWGRA